MLLVKTYLDKSPIEGLGVFAEEDIPKGTIVWEFTPGLDIIVEDHGYLPKVQWDFLEKYSFWDKQTNQWILSADNDKFTNHSDDPNTRPKRSGKMVALRDIKAGEEITANYYDIDRNASKKFR